MRLLASSSGKSERCSLSLGFHNKVYGRRLKSVICVITSHCLLNIAVFYIPAEAIEKNSIYKLESSHRLVLVAAKATIPLASLKIFQAFESPVK